MPEPHLAINGYFLDQPHSGSGQYLLRLLEELDHLWRGPITVVAPAGANTVRGPHAWTRRDVTIPMAGAPGKVWFEQIGVPGAAHSAGASLLHVPYFGAPVSSPLPVVVTVHDLIQIVIPRLRGGPLNRAYNLLAAVGARRARAVITDSQHVRAEVQWRLHITPSRVFPIHLAVDARFHPVGDQQEEEALRNRHSLHGPFVLYAGGLDWRKNVPLLIRAYARSGTASPLVIAGEARSTRSSSFPDLRDEVQKAGVMDRVRFIPMDEESKPALYRAAALYVCPSLAEGFGLTPLEALASGTPVICSNATSLPEVVGEAALLFHPTDEEELARLITSLFADRALAKRLRLAGPQQAKRFSWRSTAEQTISVYQHALQERS